MSAISRIYIETNWETFTTPYYDSEEDKVYFTYYTEITRLSPTETWRFRQNKRGLHETPWRAVNSSRFNKSDIPSKRF